MAEVVATLLSHGHKVEDVYDDYCMEELTIHYETILLQEMEQGRREAISNFNSNRASGKDFKSYVRKIDRVIKKLRNSMKHEMSEEEVGKRLQATLTKLMGMKPK